ncbi:PepSY-associated TM helix domain-containing protein [Pseudokordiimonas caeni]|uniref:PepSY-associated TM helix domain-containing protein n=1 Tax=Pseudokordiimonas caeni TaxID=2997908 RepID=UPI0028117FDA|nr:PepSY-associated TM helix domain-containing protein [Pseudokordiimonas caeni]
MKAGLRQSMAWLHTWTELLLGWLLFAMFLTGTAAYFNDEITRWMQPEIEGEADPIDSAIGAAAYLREKAPNSPSWFITPTSERQVVTNVFWRPAPSDEGGGRGRSATLDGQGTEVELRDTRGGNFLYRFHFDLHYMPVIWARYLVGVAAMFMLIAILSGVVTHKKIFADFFMLRFGKGQRSWLDAHNVTAVMALPFHLMITYTGLVTLATLYMPWAIAANYADSGTYFEALFPQDAMEATGVAAPLTPLRPVLEDALSYWPDGHLGTAQVSNPGDTAARIMVFRSPGDTVGTRAERLVFDGVSGALLSTPPARGAARETESVMVGLHAGRFAGPALRWLYFLSGVGGTIMVGSGLVLWTVKRRQKLEDPDRPHFGFRLVERLNVATVAGLPAAVAGYFIANWLLPLDLEARAEWEIHCLFILWGASLVWAVGRPVKRAWVEVMAAGACLYAAVPLVNALTTSRHLLASLTKGDWVFAGFDLSMLFFAVLIGLAARRLALHRPRERTPRVRGAKPAEALS